MKKLMVGALTLMVMLCFGAISFAGSLDDPAAPDSPASAMYTLEDIYQYLDVGTEPTKRTTPFAEPSSGPTAGTGHTLNEVMELVKTKCGCACSGNVTGTRWCDNGDGTVTDMTTCLVWLKNASWGGVKEWEDCTSHDDANTRAGLLCAGATDAGLTDGSVVGDWRLPTKTELHNLANGDEAVRSGSMRAFTGVQYSFYWSSTMYESDLSIAWDVEMHSGDVGYHDKDYDLYVWPVRGQLTIED